MIRFLVILILCSSCGVFNPEKRAYNKIKRNWNRIEETLKKYPNLADSVKIEIKDTVKTTEVRDSLVFVTSIDSTAVDSLALLLIDAKSKRDTVLINKTRYRLSTLGCPEVKKDTVYRITIFNSKDSVDIPIHLKVFAKGNKLVVNLEIPPGKLPQKFNAVSVNFPQPEKIFYQDFWFWVSCGLAVIVVFLVGKALTR